MFKKTILTALTMATVMLPATAEAQVILDTNGKVCGGATFLSCFNAKVEITGSTASSTTFRLWLQNLSPGSAFTQIGVGNLEPSNGYTMTHISRTVSGSPTASFGNVVLNPNGLSGGPIEKPIFGVDAAGNLGLTNLGIIDFSFSINRAVSALNVAGVQIAIHDQLNPDCLGSNKATFQRTFPTAATGAFLGTQATCGGGGGQNIVPEPSTYALMAAGLVGIFGVARRRRTNA